MPQKNPSSPLQIFKPGTHTAMSGQALSFSESDLQATVAAYDPARHEAPLVVGHPAHDLPAYGWVQSLAFNEGGIDATPAQVNADFADMVAAGAFKKISASFYAPSAPTNPVPGVYYLRHVGFLGALAPAVKGMRTPAFSDTEAGVLTFEFANPQDHQPQEPTVTPEEKAALEAENTRLKAELAANKAAKVHAEHTAFCESCAGVVPAHRATAVEIADQLAALPTPLEFGEGDQKAPLLHHFKAFLKALPAAVQFGEAATKARAAAVDDTAVSFCAPDGYDVDADSLARLARAQAHMRAHGGTLLDAVRTVSPT